MGTHDISLLTIDDGVIEVLAVGGDAHLGGEDIDNNLTTWVVSEFKKKSKLDISDNARALRRVKTACERAKRTLSASTSTTIEIDALADGVDFNITLTRAKFEELNTEVFKKALAPLEQVLVDAKVSKNEVDEIVLVGGSTRIPKIQKMVSDYFNGKQLNNSVNVDEAVAYGAAVQAAILSGNGDDKTSSLVLLDVTPLSIGIEVGGVQNHILIPRNTTIPCQKKDTFSNGGDNQKMCEIKVLEGERTQSSKCTVLGSFMLSDLPPARRGTLQIEVSYDLDANGILTVNAVEKSTGKSNNITITNDKGRLSKEDIERMIEEAEQFKEEDLKFKESVDAKNAYEQFVYGVKGALTDEFKQKLSEDEVKTLETTVDDAVKWLDEHPKDDKESYDTKRKEVEEVCSPLLTKAYQAGAPADGSSAPPMGGMPNMSGMPDMSQFANMMGGQGGMPQFTPEMMTQAQEMMKNMKPEDLQKMMGAMGGAAPSSGPTVSEVD